MTYQHGKCATPLIYSLDPPLTVDEAGLGLRVELGVVLRGDVNAVAGQDGYAETEDQNLKNDEHMASRGRRVSAQARAMSILTRVSTGIVLLRCFFISILLSGETVLLIAQDSQ